MNRQTKEVLGVHVDAITIDAALERAHEWLEGSQARMIVTPNPEILLAARKDAHYAAVLNGADLALPDGRGVQLFARLPERVTGVDFCDHLLELAQNRGERVACVVRRDGLSSADAVGQALLQKFPQLAVEVLSVDLHGWDTDVVLDELLESKPSIVLVGLGFPQQELFLAEHLDHIPSARIGIGVGGTFDFWTGEARRAPGWVRSVGFEWLYRLVRDPRRVKRIWNAVVVFPLRFALDAVVSGIKK